jgi:hypothetical protein
MQRILAFLDDTLREVPVMVGAQHQCPPAYILAPREHDSAGELVHSHYGAPLRTSTGAELIALRAAK